MGVMSLRFGKPSVGFYLTVVPTVLLAWRLVWEQTALSWDRGPQMVGFSLMHSGFGILLMLAFYAGLAWAAVTFAIAVFSRARRNLTNVAGAFVVAIAAVIISLPYGLWVQLFAPQIAHGPHSSKFLVYMAGTGRIPAVRALLDEGVPVSASDSNGLRAIDAAKNAHHQEMVVFLIERGATAK